MTLRGGKDDSPLFNTEERRYQGAGVTRPARGYAQVSLTRESEHRKRGSRRNGLMEADGLSRRQAGSRELRPAAGGGGVSCSPASEGVTGRKSG